jgi:hypothetical protein
MAAPSSASLLLRKVRFMKNVFAILTILVALFCISLQAAPPTGETVDGNYVWELDTTISDASSFDSLVGDDSIVIASAFKPQPGWQYILVTNALTEGAEAEFILNIASLDEDGDVMYVSSAVDTIADEGDAVLLPFGETCIGNAFKLVIVDGAGDLSAPGTTTDLNKCKIYRRRVVVGEMVRWR